jgi:uncharacterized protein YpmB
MKRKKLLFLIAIIILLLVASILVFSRSKTQTASSYEDAAGWVYSCSQPIKVKDQGVTYMNGKSSLTPVNQADAEKYCHRIGIE